MSVNIYYYSFSPKRADKQWAHFAKDMKVLREKELELKEKNNNSDKNFDQRKKLENRYQKSFEQIRGEIYDFLYYSEEIDIKLDVFHKADIYNYIEYENMTAKDKMDFLFPDLIDSKDEKMNYAYIASKVPYLIETYEIVLKSRDNEIKKFNLGNIQPPDTENEIILNERQKKLSQLHYIDELIQEEALEINDLIYLLKNLDLFFGSDLDIDIDLPNNEHIIRRSIIEYFNLDNNEGVPTRKEWIRVFKGINKEFINGCYKSPKYVEEFNHEDLEDYLYIIRPIVKDLNENVDAIFMLGNDCDHIVEPVSAEKILMDRFEKHIKMYEHILPKISY